MYLLNFLIVLVLIKHGLSITARSIYGKLNDELNLFVNSSIFYIIEYNITQGNPNPLRVSVTSEDALKEEPVTVVVRQKREVLSWELPMIIDDINGGIDAYQSARTLCYDTTAKNQTLTNSLFADINPAEDSPIIIISTACGRNVSVSVKLTFEVDFYVQPNVDYEISVTPSSPRYFFYDFPDKNNSLADNSKTVVLEVTSEDNVCMIISIQRPKCPVYDLNHNVKFEGLWQTMNRKGGITISKVKFPDGFFVVFVPKANDFDCTESVNQSTSRNKTIRYVFKPSISYNDYITAISVTIAGVVLFYVVFGISFFMCSNRVYIPRTMAYMSETAPNTPSTIQTDILDDISDEIDYDTVVEVRNDRDVILTKPEVFLSDLARKDFRILKKKSNSYLWHVLIVALFYGLPVIQLVITYQQVLNNTGNLDSCFYNFLCAHPLGILSDFNHLFSNIGYICLGLLFVWIVYRRERWHKDNSFDQHYGIPQHYGLFYAMGFALCMEGVLSGSYHVCPNHSNFQFDTSFMYVMAVLCMVKIYQTRHPDINATAYSTFGVLAAAIFLGMVGILAANLYFWISFTVFHLLAGLYLTAQIYYMGCCRIVNSRLWQGDAWRRFATDFRTAPWQTVKPRYTGRFVLLLIGNICNWALAVFGLYHHDRDFAMYLLAIFMMNTILYFIFYTVMKLLHKERINNLALLFLVISLSCAGAAIYCFLNKSISWARTPAESRTFNQECKLMRFYDFHDIWHFLSAVGMFFMFMMLLLLDDDLSHTHRTKIHVF